MRYAGWVVAVLGAPRWRKDARERLGLAVPPVQPGAIWVHASSVGEVAAALGVVAHLPDPVLLTATSDTGAAAARAALTSRPGAAAGALPADHPWALSPLWSEARPRALVFVESAWWPGLAALADEAAVPVIRVSATAGRGTRRLPDRVHRRRNARTTRVLARDEEAAAWFVRHGDCPVEVAGDPKGSRPLPPPTLQWARPFIVGASTRPGDEAALLGAVSEAQVLLAPRHLERVPVVEALLAERGLRWARRSALGAAVPAELDAVVLDSLGALAGELAGARAALIGGTFDPSIGGHSPVEAWRQGVPIVCGPHTLAHGTAFQQAGASVARTPAGLAQAFAEASPPGASAPDPGARIAAVIQSLAAPPAPEHPPRPWAQPLSAIVQMFGHSKYTRFSRTGVSPSK